MIKTYTKKLIKIKAVQYIRDEAEGTNFKEIFKFFGKHKKDLEFFGIYKAKQRYFRIKTLEGIMTGKLGDYIIKGIKGEFYPCKKEIFEATYLETK